ncbi:hypothetical protein HMPREF1141_2260 [Clostridium sp. MSTE9]|jgi:hypothetical protein|nr:hypothetical protein HMPREF1141_2260 [Clostridium sp. MSTE9]
MRSKHAVYRCSYQAFFARKKSHAKNKNPPLAPVDFYFDTASKRDQLKENTIYFLTFSRRVFRNHSSPGKVKPCI